VSASQIAVPRGLRGSYNPPSIAARRRAGADASSHGALEGPGHLHLILLLWEVPASAWEPAGAAAFITTPALGLAPV